MAHPQTSAPAAANPATPTAQATPAKADASVTPAAQVSAPAAATTAPLHASAPDAVANTSIPATAAQPDIAALAVQVAAKAKDGDHHFDIRLDPPDFGKIDVHLSVTNDGHAQAHIAADKPQTLELLQRDQGTLHRALRDAGLDVSNNSLNFSLKGQERGDGGAPRYAARTPLLTAVEAPEATGPFPFTQTRAGNGRLDIRI